MSSNRSLAISRSVPSLMAAGHTAKSKCLVARCMQLRYLPSRYKYMTSLCLSYAGCRGPHSPNSCIEISRAWLHVDHYLCLTVKPGTCYSDTKASQVLTGARWLTYSAILGGKVFKSPAGP